MDFHYFLHSGLLFNSQSALHFREAYKASRITILEYPVRGNRIFIESEFLVSLVFLTMKICLAVTLRRLPELPI